MYIYMCTCMYNATKFERERGRKREKEREREGEGGGRWREGKRLMFLHPHLFFFRFLTYIGDLCVCRGQAIQKVQMMVCNVVLQDTNADVLMKIT